MSAHVVCGLIGNVVGTTHISANEAGHFDVKEEEDFIHIINNDTIVNNMKDDNGV